MDRPGKKLRILVTDGNARAALAICRSLGKKGHQVIVGNDKPYSLAASSKYCIQRCIYPDPAKQPALFIKFLLDFVDYNKIDIILPVTDITTIPLTDNMDKFKKYCTLPFSNYESIVRAADKVDIFNLAESLSVDIPKSIVINEPGEINNLQFDFPYPVVLKPGRSRVMTESGWLYTSVTYAKSKEDLKAQLDVLDEKIFPVLIQERINGPGLGIFMCYQSGKPVAAFSHKRLREKPPSGGVSVLRESTDLDPYALQFSEALLSALDWNGIAMVEFKIDNRDNRPKLMEINGRFWGSLQLAIDAGVDFPSILIDSIDKDIEPNYDYKKGVKTRWLLGDFDALLIRMLKSNESLELPPDSPGKIQYLFDFLKLWQPGMKYEVLKIHDIKPGIFEGMQWIRNSLRALFQN